MQVLLFVIRNTVHPTENRGKLSIPAVAAAAAEVQKSYFKKRKSAHQVVSTCTCTHVSGSNYMYVFIKSCPKVNTAG